MQTDEASEHDQSFLIIVVTGSAHTVLLEAIDYTFEQPDALQAAHRALSEYYLVVLGATPTASNTQPYTATASEGT